MLAVKKHIIDPEKYPRTATRIISDLLLGANVPRVAIIIPTELGFAKPQIANVVIAELRS